MYTDGNINVRIDSETGDVTSAWLDYVTITFYHNNTLVGSTDNQLRMGFQKLTKNDIITFADEGDDYLAHIVYGVTPAKEAYILDVLYTKAPMEDTEPAVARSIHEYGVTWADIESNNGGRGFARNVKAILTGRLGNSRASVHWFHQNKNKLARILSNATNVMEHVYFPVNWADRWPEYYDSMTKFQREGRNAHDDAQDATTGVVEKASGSGPPARLNRSEALRGGL
jgi:predicted phage terminase large subunit-like protein